jgi:hypothetical protein
MSWIQKLKDKIAIQIVSSGEKKGRSEQWKASATCTYMYMYSVLDSFGQTIQTQIV